MSEAFVRGAVCGRTQPQDGAGDGDVRGVGDLDVARVCLDEHHLVSCVLDERGVVGDRVWVEVVGFFVGVTEDLGREDLGRLDRKESGAVEGLVHGIDGLLRGGAEDGGDGVVVCGEFAWLVASLDRVADRDARDKGGDVCAEGEESFDQVGRGAWAGGVVDGDVRRLLRDMLEGGGDGLEAMGFPAATDRGAQQGEAVGVSEFEVGVGLVVVGGGDDDRLDAFGDGGVFREEFDGALQERAPAEILIEFVAVHARGAEACRGAGGGDDDGDAWLRHGRVRIR